MNNRVSVLLPVYNVEKFILKSISSVLNSTYKNFEKNDKKIHMILIDSFLCKMAPTFFALQRQIVLKKS